MGREQKMFCARFYLTRECNISCVWFYLQQNVRYLTVRFFPNGSLLGTLLKDFAC